MKNIVNTFISVRRFGIILVIVVATLAVMMFINRHDVTPSGVAVDNKPTSKMILTSPSFENNELIPPKFSCDGGDINPELHIQNVPEGAKSLALIMDDPDATGGNTFTHWLLWNINPLTTIIKQESKSPASVEGQNGFGSVGYGGPCPPKESGPHRYFFKLYALDSELGLQPGATKENLESEIKKHLIEQTDLIGLYKRQ